MQTVDVLYAHKEENSVVKALKKARENSEIEFQKIFVSASQLGRDLHGACFWVRDLHPDLAPAMLEES